MAKRFYIATAADGTVFKRSSDRRTYTHCVVAFATITPADDKEQRGFIWRKDGGENVFGPTWAGRPDLAQKATGQFAWIANIKRVTAWHTEVLPAIEIDAKAFKAA